MSVASSRHRAPSYGGDVFAFHITHSNRERTIRALLMGFLIVMVGCLYSFTVQQYAATRFDLPRLEFSGLAAAGQTPAAEPPPVAPDKSQAVQAVLDKWSIEHPDKQWSVSVLGLRGDSLSASLQPTRRQDMASVYKLLVLHSLVQKTPRAKWADVQLTVEDKQVTLAACVDKMILISDNPCGEAVASYVGWGKTDKALAAFGLKYTWLDVGTEGSAGDAAQYLKLLDEGTLMSAADKEFVFNLLKSQRHRRGLPAGCSDCTVYNKTGETSVVRNDAGIVEFSGGRAIAVAIFTDGASWPQIAELHRQIVLSLAN